MSIEKLIAKGDHDGVCEWCEKPGMTDETVVETDLNFYCSEECREKAEGADVGMSDEALRRWEAHQMGITG